MLKLNDLSVGYGPFTAVHDLTLTIDEGTVFAMIGANGAGKSSTIMAIAGHADVVGGQIEFDGRDITGLAVEDRIGAGIALVPEGRRLFPDLTVADNLTIGGYSRPQRDEARNRDKVVSLFPCLGERLAQQAGTLSGGEQQMLAMGRGLMAEPKFLMVDEVSLGLMPKAVEICYEAIQRLKADGITVLLVEQNTSRALDIADRVCVLESGHAVWEGGAEEARRDTSMIDAYMGLSRNGTES